MASDREIQIEREVEHWNEEDVRGMFVISPAPASTHGPRIIQPLLVIAGHNMPVLWVTGDGKLHVNPGVAADEIAAHVIRAMNNQIAVTQASQLYQDMQVLAAENKRLSDELATLRQEKNVEASVQVPRE